jgi:flagellar basal-body rod protein FlgG
MERALWSAVTGMQAQELSLDTIANNLANINTTSFKSSRINFQDLLYSAISTPGATSGQSQLPTGIQVGHGTKVASIAKQFRQGSLIDTGGDFDIAIEGEGFFEIEMPDGTKAYTRDGSFKMNSSGEIVTSDGYRVAGIDAVDQGTTEATIAPDGSFSTVVNGTATQKSRLTLTRFPNPQGLRAAGRNLYIETEASGTPQTGLNPGENGVGSIAQRRLEASNVNAAEELVSLITTQRAYEATSKAIKAADELMGMANSLNR